MIEAVLMQVAGTTTATTSTLAESLGSISQFCSSSSWSYYTHNCIDPRIYEGRNPMIPKINEALDTGIAVGKVATATANKALENKQNIKTLIDLGLQTLPQDTRQAIASKQALIDRLNKEIQATTAQIKQLTPIVPEQPKCRYRYNTKKRE